MNKKVTDFIKLENGNIGRKAAVMTGAALAASVLGALLTSPVEAGHCNIDCGHSNYWYSTCGGGCWMHQNASCHINNPSGPCPQ